MASEALPDCLWLYKILLQSTHLSVFNSHSIRCLPEWTPLYLLRFLIKPCPTESLGLLHQTVLWVSRIWVCNKETLMWLHPSQLLVGFLGGLAKEVQHVYLSLFLLPADPDVELSPPSPVSCLFACCPGSYHNDCKNLTFGQWYLLHPRMKCRWMQK